MPDSFAVINEIPRNQLPLS